MGRKPVVKNKEFEKKDEQKVDRKEYIRKALIEHLEEIAPEIERKFNMTKVCETQHTRGSFRNFMEGDFKSEDRKLFREICQDLKNEEILLHIGGQWWARLK